MKHKKIAIPWQTKEQMISNSLLAVFILVSACLICDTLRRLQTGEQNIIVVMVLAVFVIAAATDGYAYGLCAAIIGVFAYDFLITSPRFGFSFTVGFPITLSLLLLVTVTTSSVTARMKKQARLARKQEQRAERLYDINRKLLSSRDEATIARYVMEYLKDDLRRSIALYTTLEDTGSPGCYFRQAEGDITSDYFASDAGQRAAAFTMRQKSAHSDAVACYVPVIAQDQVYGVLGISALFGPLSASKQVFLDLMAEQAAQALRVNALTVHRQEAQVMAETEKARNSFLRGISHDLRTPLTGIIGASATFLDNREQLPVETQIQLVEGIQADSQWLLNMVENVLSVTKLYQNNISLKKNEEIVEEVVGEAVAQFRRRYPGVDISVRQPDDLLLVSMDTLLMMQVFNNLFENAYRHGGGAETHIVVSMSHRGSMAEFTVTDTGPGIPPEELPRLFEIRPAAPKKAEDSSRGLGIGLLLCKSIVEAHNGWIQASNLPGGGACFVFALPAENEKEAANGE